MRMIELVRGTYDTAAIGAATIALYTVITARIHCYMHAVYILIMTLLEPGSKLCLLG
jgi:hypothetical protein